VTAVHQVRVLLALRWKMLRSVKARLAVVAGMGVAAGLILGVATVAGSLSREFEQGATVLLPALLATFIVLAVVGGLAAGGGTEIIPAGQLITYPISPRAIYLGSVALAPLNFAWAAQIVVLVGMVVYLATPRSAAPLGVLLLLTFAGTSTALGLAVSWFIVGIRQNQVGRWVTTSLGLLTVAVAILAALTGVLRALIENPLLINLAQSLTRPLSATALGWFAALALLSVTAATLGSQACNWSLRRRDVPTGTQDSRRHLRRNPKSSAWRETVAVDRGSVWRSRPIRRGLVLMGLAPGVAAAVSAVGWEDLVVLPPLVAAGAALLFAINVLSLDGPGALWLESTPRSPALALASKAWVSGEVVLFTVACSMLVITVALGPPQQPRLALTLALSMAVGVVWAVALALRRSVRTPNKADLQSARDTPGPPAAMLAHAVRLTTFAIVPGVGFTLLLVAGPWWLLLVFAAGMLGLAALHVRHTWQDWSRPAWRALVVTRVARG